VPATGPRTELLAFLALLGMTAAWGSTFFLIKDIVTRIPVPDLLAVRFAVATIALVLIAGRQLRISSRTAARGVVLGALYGVAQLLQTVGLAHTAASVSGFLTGLYVVATPLLGALIFQSKITRTAWLATILATLGLAVLSLRGLSIGYGELLTCCAAVIYAGHIVALGRLSEPHTAVGLSVVQLVVITVICTIAAALGGQSSGPGIQLPGSARDWLTVLYLAVIAGALTMVLQTWAQARVEPSRAAVIMAVEPVWAAAFAVALGGESVTIRMIIGGLAIISAMYLVERAPRRRRIRELA
jgi:drug/metabolite transporter (DMT)-like permease